MNRFCMYPLACLLLLLTVLTGCQTHPKLHTVPVMTTQLWADQAFSAPSIQLETEQEIFAIPADTVSELRRQLQQHDDHYQRSMALVAYIFNDGRDELEYVNSATLVASDTLKRRQANCLSLTILAYSLAQSLGFEVEFQDVTIPEYWVSRSGSMLLNGHVNLVLLPTNKMFDMKDAIYARSGYLIDFDRVPARSRLKSTVIQRPTIVSMFYNNRAADALIAHNYDVAYLYLKQAIQLAPQQVANWNNLAVLYRHKRLFAQAEQVYRHSLQLEPDHSNTLANLAALYQLTDRPAEAALLEQRVEKKRLANPFYFVMLGNEAFERHEQDTAIAYFRKALKLQSNVPEALFGLAKSYLMKGDFASATRYLQAAKKHVGAGSERRLYQSKLDLLNAIARR